MRVFIGLTEVAGYFGNLAKGLNDLGIKTTFVDLYSHPFQYAGRPDGRDRLVDLHRLFLDRRNSGSESNRLATIWWASLQKACVLAILIKATITCDAFIFSSDTTFLRYLELPVLRLLGKRLIFVFTGSDHRPSFMNGPSLASLDDRTVALCRDQARQIKAKLRMIERNGDVIVGHHLCAHFHERPFVPIALLGFPFTTETVPGPVRVNATQEGVRIVHAPSRPREKGTAEIRAAIQALRARGFAIELIELVDQPNQVVLNELARCDFVVDEVYSDTRMAGLATEAAFFGKATVVGGYARDEDLAIEGVYSASEFPPVQFCHPDHIMEAIEQLITDVTYRLELGERAREFVSTRWTPIGVARRYVALIEDRIPDSWMFDPRGIRYFAGAGMPEMVTRAAVRRLIELFGIGALCLSDKPEMECAFEAYGAGKIAISAR